MLRVVKKCLRAIAWILLVSIVIGLTWLVLNTIENRPVKLLNTMATPTPFSGILFDHCKLPENSSGQEQVKAGTPVPVTPVVNGADWSDPTATPSIAIPNETMATAVNVPMATTTPSMEGIRLQAVITDDFNGDNYHVVIVGVGYSEEEIATEFVSIIGGLKSNFRDVKVDFTYILQPVDVSFDSQGPRITFTRDEDRLILTERIKAIYPADSIVVAVKTNLIAGSSYNHENILILTTNNPGAVFIATHEIAHQLGLGDGYKTFYFPRELPNSELFYLDEMPDYLVQALNERGVTPPMYIAGTCNGRVLYTFYETKNNIMGNYAPEGRNPWGESWFTPIQLQIMNDKIRDLRGN
ncbi:MAG: hypothetical protein UW41_C0004G0015 [Candidatus Collierbacteria bacterium GW2011_GWC2_44_18]|uniref:Uncharacterized protein n=1 Tax=Candidatus Collierbacteria bacterium GW2011_GWC2_44_18 TaxID=1618392 RepID=A0A0G1KNT1_9BACT|nr:MAG: hypothetical protein UW41_C0004G0015 [Candidatus Collierbacteria bacterium GW2011_GWC2_44_18]